MAAAASRDTLQIVTSETECSNRHGCSGNVLLVGYHACMCSRWHSSCTHD
jgi:hypothetical protein